MRYPDEDERLKALRDEQNGGAAPISEEANPLEREPDADADDAARATPAAVPPQQLASQSYAPEFDGLGSMPYEPPQKRVELEAPPMKEAPGLPQTIVGGVLDVLINKGRGLPKIVAGLGSDDTPYDNWKRKKEWSESVNGGGRGYASPQSLWLRQQAIQQRRAMFDESLKQRAADRALRDKALGQGDQRIKIAEGGQKLKETAQDRELNPDNPQLAAMKAYAYSLGAPEGSLDGMDAKAVRDVKTMLEKDMETRANSPLAQQDIAHGAASAGANSAATKQDRIDIAQAGAGIQADKEKTQNADLSQITGWTRRPDAPELKPAESESLRKTDAAAQQYDEALQRLRDANTKLGKSDYAQALIGKHTPAMAAAIAAHSNVITKQRVLENLGTPQAAELKMVNKQVPAPDSFGGAVNGDAAYGALLNEYRQNHSALMQKYGYERASAAPAGGLGVTDGAGPKVGDVVTPHGHAPVAGKRKTAQQLAAEGWE